MDGIATRFPERRLTIAMRETQVSLDLWSDKLARVTVELSQWHRWWKQQGNRELRDLLMLWWDPLGVYGIPEAIDEYDDHVGRVGRLLREGATQARLAAYFSEHDFELGADRARGELPAEKTFEWYTRSMARLSETQEIR
jgi:hypothetical protein